jgi:hypothetical protein
VFPTIHRKIGEILELRSSRLPPNHPDQPQIITPLNMVVPGEDNPNSEKASEIASEAVASKKVIS